MAVTTIIATTQKRVKDSFASSPSVGLAVRANGEETVKVIDHQGNVYEAYIEAPTVAPTFVGYDTGNLTANKYVAYVFGGSVRYEAYLYSLF